MEKRTNDMMSKIFGHFKPFKVTKIPLDHGIQKLQKKDNNLSDIAKNNEEYHMIGRSCNYKIKEKEKTKQLIKYKPINLIKQPYNRNLHQPQNNDNKIKSRNVEFNYIRDDNNMKMMQKYPTQRAGFSEREKERERENRYQMINNNKRESKSREPRDSLSKIIIRKSSDDYYNHSLNRNSVSLRQIYRNPLNFIGDRYYLGMNNNIKKYNFDYNGFIRIPAERIPRYSSNTAIVIRRGINSGQYKFKGERTFFKTNISVSPLNDLINSKDDIYSRSYKNYKNFFNKNEKRSKFEVIDKFYVFTEYDSKKNIFSIIDKDKYKNKNKEEINKKLIEKYLKTEPPPQKYKNDNKNEVTYETKIKFNNYRNKINFNSLNIASKPEDNYSKYFLAQINKIRTDPQSFVGIIEDSKYNIIKDRYGRIMYNGKIKVKLIFGEPAFDDAIEFLNKAKPMNKLEFSSIITPQLPKNEEEMKDKNDLRKKVSNMAQNGINIKSYWKDFIKDPETSFLLMIVDDIGIKGGMRRKDLLDPKMKYIGISSTVINDCFICYIALSSGILK